MIVTLLLWFSLLACGLIAGLYFAFSAFIMTALARLGPEAGAAAMDSINTAILRSLFMPLFLGSSLSCLALAVLGLIDPAAPGAAAMIAGGLCYVLGMTGVTMAFNVPLNNALLAARGEARTEAWNHYLRRWTAWNHVRTIASTAAMAAFAYALAAR